MRTGARDPTDAATRSVRMSIGLIGRWIACASSPISSPRMQLHGRQHRTCMDATAYSRQSFESSKVSLCVTGCERYAPIRHSRGSTSHTGLRTCKIQLLNGSAWGAPRHPPFGIRQRSAWLVGNHAALHFDYNDAEPSRSAVGRPSRTPLASDADNAGARVVSGMCDQSLPPRLRFG